MVDVYEPGTTRLVQELLKEGDQFVIAGAHQGFYATLAAALVGPKGKVYAFEPEPTNFEILKKAVEPFDNVKLYNFALGDREYEKAPFFFNSDNDGGHSLFNVAKFVGNVKTQANPIVFNVEVKRLDDVLADEDLSKLKLMLFDVEGAEHALLKGAVNTLVDYTPYVITEINNSALTYCQTSQMALRSFMSLLGYTPFSVDFTKVDPMEPTEFVKFKDNEDNECVFNILFKHITAQ